MADNKEVIGENEHDICHNPCQECQGKGSLGNGEVCPTCAGTGCKDEKFCSPAGGLGCDT